MTIGWRALHIFHSGDLDALLVEAIAPAMRRLREAGSIERYFFLRYWNGGPHLRLRCLVRREDDLHGLKAEIEGWLQTRPAPDPEQHSYEAGARQIREIEARLGADQGGAAEPLEPLRPANTVELRPYHFDAARYGYANEEDTHDHAWVSSRIVLTALRLPSADPGRRASLALDAGAVIATRLGVSWASATELFEEMSRWNRPAPGDPDDDAYWSAEGFPHFSAQGARLDPARALLAEAQCPALPPDRALLLGAWRREADRRADFLREAARRGAVPGEPAHLLLDALHLFCNRLGLGLAAECYLYHLLAKLLRADASGGHAMPREAVQ